LELKPPDRSTQVGKKFLLPLGEGQDEVLYDPLTPTLSRREREKKPPRYFTGMYAVVFRCLKKRH